ncbi:hypothetical protein TeGR_g1891, partial [Tetraparma gracilis]
YETSPASVVEAIARHEQVHPVRTLSDMRSRLGNGRRCLGFFHPSLPEKPLVFVHVALMPDLTGSMLEIRGSPPLLPEADARAAIFYSINATNPGLAGVDLGNALIKRAASLLAAEFPELETFSTLSPVPGFRSWLEVKAASPPPFALSDSELFGPHLAPFLSLLPSPPPASALSSLLSYLSPSPADRLSSPAAPPVLRPLLLRLLARYLCLERRRNRPVDGVAKFHLGNGAALRRLNWMADPSGRGMGQSYGMMVNYEYGGEGEVDGNRGRFGRGEVVRSEEVERHLE